VNLKAEAVFITMRVSGFLTEGEPIISLEIITVQFAVPPRISAQ
jgi:hypothetical protein